MAKPTLLIGIGTSGLRVLEETQKFYYEHTGKNKPGNVEYIYLETDESSFPSTTVLKNEIQRVYLDLSDKESKINNLQHKLGNDGGDWIPDPSYIKDVGKGAAGMPAFGRVSLWSSPNFDAVKDQIRSSMGRINSHTQKESDKTDPAVFIVGSLTGGTGSGVFIDIAYMVKEHIKGITDLYGLFLTPGRDYMGRDNILYCNTLYSLAALEKHNTISSSYAVRWPNATHVDISGPPFEMTHFISQDRDDGSTQVKSVEGLYKIAGLWMFLNIFGLREKRDRRTTDGKSSAFIGKYGTFGISAVQYPKKQLEELLGIDLSIELLERWVDHEAYYNKGTKTQIKTVKQNIVKDTERFFERTLTEAFKTLDATLVDGESRISYDLKKKADQINRREFNEESEYHFIKKWFSSNGDNNYYTAIKNSLKKAEDEIILRVDELIRTTLDKTENLHISIIQLEAIVDYIKKTTKYWGNMNLSPKPEKWENLLERQIGWILNKRYRLIGEQNNVLYDRLYSTYELMKIHLMGERIMSIRNNLSDQTDALTAFDSGIKLPKVEKVKSIIRQIQNVIESTQKSQEYGHKKTLRSRYDEITAELKDDSIPILRVYRDGSTPEAFKRTYDSAKSKYFQKSESNIPSKRTIIGEAPLWGYLNTPEEKFFGQLYGDCITKLEENVSKYNCVEDIDVTEYISKHINECGKMALFAESPLFMVNNDNRTNFENAKGIPRLVIGKNSKQVNQVFESLESSREHRYLNSFQKDEDGTWLNEDINNLVVFYVEQAYMSTGQTFNPLKHVRNVRDILRINEEESERYSGVSGTDSSVWHLLRSPYMTEEEADKIFGSFTEKEQ